MSVHSSLQGQGIKSSFIVLTSIKDTWGLNAVTKPKQANNKFLSPRLTFGMISTMPNITEADEGARIFQEIQ